MSSSGVDVTIDIAASPEEVWALVTDPDRLEEWVSIHRRLDDASDGPLAVGSTIEQTLSLRGVPFKVHWRVTECDPPRVCRWEGRGPAGSRATTVYRLTPNGEGGTRFSYENEFRAPFGPLGAVASRALVGGIPKREAEATLEQLKRLLERG